MITDQTDRCRDYKTQLSDRLVEAGGLVVLSDFDGTLTPLVDHPDSARIDSDVRELLGRLASLPSVRVGIISGRAIHDVSCRVGLSTLIYAGNHGLEIRGNGLCWTHPIALRLKARLRSLSAQFERELSEFPGVIVEDKGLSATVHVRMVARSSVAIVRRRIETVLNEHESYFFLSEGRRVYEVRPRVEWDKGSASRWILNSIGFDARACLVIGDDHTDEDAFRGLPEAVSIRVGGDGPSAAGHRVKSTGDVLSLLRWVFSLCEDYCRRESRGRCAI